MYQFPSLRLSLYTTCFIYQSLSIIFFFLCFFPPSLPSLSLFYQFSFPCLYQVQLPFVSFPLTALIHLSLSHSLCPLYINSSPLNSPRPFSSISNLHLIPTEPSLFPLIPLFLSLTSFVLYIFLSLSFPFPLSIKFTSQPHTLLTPSTSHHPSSPAVFPTFPVSTFLPVSSKFITPPSLHPLLAHSSHPNTTSYIWFAIIFSHTHTHTHIYTQGVC